jgi:hypothetical protein
MSIHANFTFDSAGQGLFYHGNINFYHPKLNVRSSFYMVYDCGTSSNIRGAKKHLTDLVKEYSFSNRTGNIDLLAISHFDYDHISHIPELLSLYKPRTVMIPHLAKELRAVLFARSVFKENDNNLEDNQFNKQLKEIIDIFQDPITYFMQREVEQIIGITSIDDKTYIEKPFLEYKPDRDKAFVKDNLRLQYVEGGKRQQHGEKHQHLYTVYSGSPTYRISTSLNSWLFRPLNIQDQLPQSFYDDVNSLIVQFDNSWWELLKDHSRITKLVKIYDCYLGKRHRNSHSLLLRHYPEQHGFSYLNDKCHHYGKRCINCCHCFDMYGRHCHCDNTATLLLGDLELDSKAQNVLVQNQFIDSKIGTVLIPHHGANSADLLWLDKRLRNHSSCVTMIVSYGNGNSYGHPVFLHDGSMAELENPVAFANEIIPYKYLIGVQN